MLEDIGSIQNVPQFLEDVKQRKKKLMGFGHRVYKEYDPRARIVQQIAYEVIRLIQLVTPEGVRCCWNRAFDRDCKRSGSKGAEG